MRKLRILGVLIFCFTGLAAIAQQPTADSQSASGGKPSKATVYVYRYK